MIEIQHSLRETILRYNMFQPGARLGVAVSGGADSVALLHLLVDLSLEWNLELTVLHLNHCLRGAESDADQSFVGQLADSLGLKFLAKRVEVAALGGNLEQAARDSRRRFYFDTIAAGTVEQVALGHTRNDQAETVLFRLLRGSYTTGLSGMRPVTEQGLVRPLIDITRQAIEEFLRARGLAWREDASNRDLSFARNRIRYQLLPELTANWNPNLAESLANFATLAQEDEDYWTTAAGFETIRGQDMILADVESLRKLPRALRRRVLRDIIRQCKGDLLQVDFRHIEQILPLLESTEGHGRTILPGVDVMRSFEWLRFARSRVTPEERNWESDVSVNASYVVPGQGTEIVVQLRSTGTSGAVDKNTHDTLGSVELDWKQICDVSVSLSLRNWRPGDRIRLVGHEHEEKIKTLFNEARVPLWDRRNWPMLCVGDRIIWTRRFGGCADLIAGTSAGPVLRIFERKRVDP